MSERFARNSLFNTLAGLGTALGSLLSMVLVARFSLRERACDCGSVGASGKLIRIPKPLSPRGVCLIALRQPRRLGRH